MSPSSPPGYRIRPYAPRDLDAVYEICLLTGDSGEDARPLYDDPRVLGHVYAGPYLSLEPELAFVLTDKEGVCGYILGTLDTARFERAYRQDWLPGLQARYPDPGGAPKSWTADERIHHLLHHPEEASPALLVDYPSHLHIDLLPRAQGRGHGARLMDAFLEALKAAGSAGVHLGMGARNTRAYRFYLKYGFTELSHQGGRVTFGMRL